VINKLSHLPILRMQSDARNNVMPLARDGQPGGTTISSAQRMRAVCEALGISCSPTLEFTRGRSDLLALANGRSVFSSGQREGIYCRAEEDGRCVARAKLVRPGYQPRSDEEWKRHGAVRNKLR
jgi:hypothetical protein